MNDTCIVTTFVPIDDALKASAVPQKLDGKTTQLSVESEAR